MVRRLVPLLCPVLLAAFPLLSLFSQNQTDAELSVLWLPLVLCLLGAAVVVGVSVMVTRNAARGSVLASVVVLGFFYYGLRSERTSWWFFALWVALFLAAAGLVIRTKRELGNLALVLTVGAVVAVLPSATSITLYHLHHHAVSATNPRLWPAVLPQPVVSAGASKPDIYVIIPDDYARLDVLKQYFHYDDSELVRELEKRGFTVSPQARSPYSDSESNIAALVNLDYLSSFPDVLGEGSQDVRTVKRVIADNRAARLLRPLGYDYVHLDTDEVTFAGSNPDISPLAPPDSFMNLGLRKSILTRFGGPLGFDAQATNARFRSSIRSQFARLESLPRGTRPRFVVFHTLLPHDPYLLGPQGQAVTFPGHTDQDLSSATGRAYYAQQLAYTRTALLKAIDGILARSATPPVIVLQADEGFQADPENFGEEAMKEIRVKGLSALYLPGHKTAGVPDPPNSVNDLRFVFNLYLGTTYPMLDSASYAEADLPYDFSEEIPLK